MSRELLKKRSVQYSTNEAQNEVDVNSYCHQPLQNVMASDNQLAMLADAAEMMTANTERGMQPPSTLHKETTVDLADAGNLMIQREIEIFRQKLERLQSELSYSAASRENYSQSNPVHGSTHVLVTNRGCEYVERDIVRPAAATAVSQLPYPVAARIGYSRSVNCSSTHRPSSTSGRADQTHLKSVVCTEYRSATIPHIYASNVEISA